MPEMNEQRRPNNGLEPDEIHVPEPSVWPVALAGGITLLLAGVIFSLVFSAAGLLLIALAVAGWIREINDAQ